jgi:hypothetical protein
MPALIDDGMPPALAAVVSPKDVASDIVDRFGGRVDRAGFSTPYLISAADPQGYDCRDGRGRARQP